MQDIGKARSFGERHGRKRRRGRLCWFTATFSLAMVAAFAQAQVIMENSHVKLTFDVQTAALVQVADKKHGFSLDFAAETPLWMLTILDAAVQPPNVTKNDFKDVWATDVEGGRSTWLGRDGAVNVLRMGWQGVPLPNGGTAAVEVEVRLPDGSAESRWRIELSTVGEADALWRVAFPVFLLEPIGGDAENDIAAVPIHSGLIVRNPHENNVAGIGGPEIGAESSVTGGHPGTWEMQWMQIYDESSLHGIFLRSTDDVGYAKGLTMTPFRGGTALMWRHYPEDNNTTSRSYAPAYDVRLEPLQGDWYDAVGRYREWLLEQRWCAAGPLRARQDIPRAKAESVGISLYTEVAKLGSTEELLQAHQGWLDFFMGAGRIVTHLRGGVQLLPLPEPSQEYTQALAALVSLGFYSMPYTNTHGWPRSWPDDEEGTCEAANAKTLNGERIYTSQFDAWKMCPGEARWRERYVEVTEAMIDAGNTDQYCDLYPTVRLCFDADHGHPLGGGRWWIESYREEMRAVREAARVLRPDFMMVPEHRSETGIDLFDAYSLNYWTYKDHVFRGNVETGIPTPIVAATIHDYIGCSAGTQVPYDMIGSRHFRFAQAWGFVNGNVATMYCDLPPDMVQYSESRLRDYRFLREMIRYRSSALKYLQYGKYLRPPDTGAGIQEIVMYDEPFVQPVVLSGAFRAHDGSTGVFLTNYNTEPKEIALLLIRDELELGDGTYEIYSITPEGRHKLGELREAQYVHNQTLEPDGILMLELAPVGISHPRRATGRYAPRR
ncbi:MAG: DUF6259 domain-containing protein [Thermoanaerobaculales bacterium]